MFQHSSECLSLPHDDPVFMTKDAPSGPLYLQQQRTLEIIQLTEVPPPPRAQVPFTLTASSLASSSYTSSSDGSEEDDESVCSSYCSSDPEEDCRVSTPDDTYKTRLHRVLVWREMLAKAMGASFVAPPTPSSPPPPRGPLKRKADMDVSESEDDAASHSSKRSRSSAYRSQAPLPRRRLSAHSCPACDASFSTRQSLHKHGRHSARNDACRAAVEYGFEA